MAKANPAQSAPEEKLTEVEIPSASEALQMAVAQGKEVNTEYVTDTTDALEVVDQGATKVVRW